MIKDRFKGRTRKKTMTSAQVAEELECATITVHRLIDRGELDEFRFTDRGWRQITVESFRAYLARRAKRTRPRK